MPPTPSRPGRRTPALGVAWDGRSVDLLEAVADFVDVVEVAPDRLVGPDGNIACAPLRELDRIAPRHDVTYHGSGLPLGSSSGWDDERLGHLETMLAWRRPLAISEPVGAGLPALTVEALDLVVQDTRRLGNRYGIPIVLDPTPSPPGAPAHLSPATFVNTVAAETGARLLLHVGDLTREAARGRLDLEVLVDELDWAAVGELRVDEAALGRPTPAAAQLLRTALVHADRLELVVLDAPQAGSRPLQPDTVRARLAALRDVLDAPRPDRPHLSCTAGRRP